MSDRCSVCDRSLDGQSEFMFFVHTPAFAFAIGPVCPLCYEFAVKLREPGVRVRQTNPDGTEASWPLMPILIEHKDE